MLLSLIALILIIFLAPKLIRFIFGLAVMAILWKIFKASFKIVLILVILLIVVKGLV